MGDVNWFLDVNFAGVPFEAGVSRPPTGGYKVQILGTEKVPGKNDPTSFTLEFNLKILEAGVFLGSDPGKIRIGMDMSKVGNSARMKTALASIGASPAALEANGRLTPQHFNGKIAYIWIDQPPEGEKNESGLRPFADLKFIRADRYEAAKQVAVTAVSAQVPTTVPSFAAIAPQPVNGLGGTAGVGGVIPF